jgi:hypothetical protein
MHTKDLVMKKMVSSDLSNMAYEKNHDTLLLYLAAWLMSPMLDLNRMKEIEEILDFELRDED